MSLPTLNWPQSLGGSFNSPFLLTRIWYGSGDGAYGGLSTPETYSNLKDALNGLAWGVVGNRIADRVADRYEDPDSYHPPVFSGENYLTYLDEFFSDSFVSMWPNPSLAEEFEAITNEIFSATTVTESGLSLSIPISETINEDLANLEKKIRRAKVITSSNVVKLLTVWMRDEDDYYPHGEYYDIWYLGGGSK